MEEKESVRGKETFCERFSFPFTKILPIIFYMMNTHDFLPVIKAVLSDKRVIITAVVVFVFMDLCAYVVKYRKKPKMGKPKKTIAAPAPAPAENADEGGGADAGGDEE